MRGISGDGRGYGLDYCIFVSILSLVTVDCVVIGYFVVVSDYSVVLDRYIVMRGQILANVTLNGGKIVCVQVHYKFKHTQIQ